MQIHLPNFKQLQFYLHYLFYIMTSTKMTLSIRCNCLFSSNSRVVFKGLWLCLLMCLFTVCNMFYSCSYHRYPDTPALHTRVTTSAKPTLIWWAPLPTMPRPQPSLRYQCLLPNSTASSRAGIQAEG